MIKNTQALLMVDLQNDFCAGGNLAVPGGEEVIALANELQHCFSEVIASQDWHPADHVSFAANHVNRQVGDFLQMGELKQMLWPIHCVQQSAGAEFHPELNLTKINHIVFKGTDKSIDSYSVFFDNAHQRSTGLADYLHKKHIKSLYIMGLATDYCVKFSVLDALALGFEVNVIVDACRGVEWQTNDIAKALAEMQTAGAKLVTVKDVARIS